MKQEKWIKELRDKLADYEVAAPEGLWADIEAALPESLPAAPEKAKPAGARFVALRRWAVAASLLALIATGGYLWQTRNESPAEEGMTAQAKPSPSAKQEPAAPTVQTEEAPANQAAQPETPAIARASAAKDIPPTSKKPETPKALTASSEAPATSSEMLASSDTPATKETPASSETPEATVTQDNRPAVSSTPESDILRQIDKEIAQLSTNTHHPSPFTRMTVNLFAMNGLNEQMGSNGVIMAPQKAANFLANTRSARSREIIYLAGYEERQKHYRPLSIGLTASYPLTRWLSISTGIVGTRLHADFLYIMPYQRISKQQTLYYVGIPLNAVCRLWSYKGLKVYASAGAQADFNVKTHLETDGVEQKLDKDRMQWSVNGSLGVQYDIIPQLGLYAEPGIKYYFDNGTRMLNYFKDKPTNLNLQVGLRLNIGHSEK